LFIDMKLEFNKLYNDYLHEAMLLSLAGLLAIVGLLAVTLRSRAVWRPCRWCRRADRDRWPASAWRAPCCI
jgi:hypothetical protein